MPNEELTREFEKDDGKGKSCYYDHVWVHQVGPDQVGFFRFIEKEVFPKLDRD